MNGMRRNMAMTPAVGKFLPKLTRKAMEKYGFSAAALITDWAQIVGPELARHTQPLRLKWPRGVDAYSETEADATGRPGAVLHLRVDGARALDVQYQSRQITDRINGYFGYRAVAELRIVQAPVMLEQQPLTPRQVVGRPRGRAQSAGSSGRPALDLQSVADERLRASLERLQKAIVGG